MRILTLNSDGKIIGSKTVKDDCVLEEYDIVSEIGEIGQIQQKDGSFIDDTTPITPTIIQPTNQEINDKLNMVLNVLFDMANA